MAIQNTLLANTTPTSIFTASNQQALTVIYLCNTSTAPVTINVYLSPDSNVSVSNTIYSSLELTANDTYIISQEKLILDTGNQVLVEANVANAVTATVSFITI
jgi:hypothetical protein